MIDLKPACGRMAELVAGVGDEQLADPTPCSEYTVRDLIDHVEEVARGFAELAGRETPADGETANSGWRERVVELVRGLGSAWDDPAAWRGGTDAGGGLELPNEVWGKIALTEMVVHGWDLARATGQPFELPDDTLRGCYEHVAEFVPNAPVPSLWGEAVPVPDDAPLLDRIVGITGRRPSA